MGKVVGVDYEDIESSGRWEEEEVVGEERIE